MPELMEDELEVEMPAAPEIPVRPGEEGYTGSLGVQYAQMRESLLKELKSQWEAIKESSDGGIRKFSDSKAARKRQRLVLAKVDELKKLTFRRGDRYEGPCAPFTVVNLNPVPLFLQGELRAYAVPAAGAGLKVTVTYNGRKFVGSYVTFQSPHVWMKASGTQHDTGSGIDTPSMDVNYIPPAGLAHQFYMHYVQGASDAPERPMGGILMFEGDIHTLDAVHLERSNGSIWVPKMDLTLDGTGEAVYTVEEKKFKDVLAICLEQQSNFAGAKISEGHQYATSQREDQRAMLNRTDHVVWHNYALDKGYIQKPLSWATETLKARAKDEQVVCPNCTTRQENPEQHACRTCNTFYDPCKSYLAGKPVPPDQLMSYDEDSSEWEAIVKETQKRQRRKAMLDGAFTAAEAPVATGQKRGKAKADAGSQE